MKAWLAPLAIVLCAACSSSRPPAATTAAATVQPVPRANLANAAAPVQQMLRDRYAAVDQVRRDDRDRAHLRGPGEERDRVRPPR